MNPLSFEEYLSFSKNSHILTNPLLFKNDIETNFEIFLNNQFIEAISIPEIDAKKEYYVGIMKKIIFEDIPSAFTVSNPEILWRIIRMIAQNPGILIDYKNLSNEIGLSNKTVSSYLYFLEESFLVKKVYNFSRNQITSEKKLKRFYLASPSFSWALTVFHATGRLVENLAASLGGYNFFWRDSYHHEVDFIKIEKDDAIIPIEIKYKETIQPKDLKNLLILAKKFDARRAMIFKKGTEEKSTIHPSYDVEIFEKPVYKLSSAL